ncbi:DNA replication initiation control protein YabA [Fructilactobacillus vespulae]|uniref:DNA replication initiation control protein YabA n=1 Tax=Fructilactobacillus vespulae TaxID=1249630 RepID=UPI0039B6021C
MDSKQINENIDQLSLQFSQMVTEVAKMKDSISAILEENSELKIENEHLRELLRSSEKKGHTVHGLSKSKKNLEKLYNQGFHICNESYGKRREKNESCIFCTQIIYGER